MRNEPSRSATALYGVDVATTLAHMLWCMSHRTSYTPSRSSVCTNMPPCGRTTLKIHSLTSPSRSRSRTRTLCSTSSSFLKLAGWPVRTTSTPGVKTCATWSIIGLAVWGVYIPGVSDRKAMTEVISSVARGSLPTIVAGFERGGGGTSDALSVPAGKGGDGVAEQPPTPTTIRTAVEQHQPGELKSIHRLDQSHRLDEQD